MLDNSRRIIDWAIAALMAVLTAIAEEAVAVEPDRLIWMLGFAGALFGAALLPSAQVWRTVAKLMFGWSIAGVAATPIVAAHYAPPFVNPHVAALWLGFAGPAIFLATLEGNAFVGRFLNRGKGQ